MGLAASSHDLSMGTGAMIAQAHRYRFLHEDCPLGRLIGPGPLVNCALLEPRHALWPTLQRGPPRLRTHTGAAALTGPTQDHSTSWRRGNLHRNLAGSGLPTACRPTTWCRVVWGNRRRGDWGWYRGLAEADQQPPEINEESYGGWKTLSSPAHHLRPACQAFNRN
jgi:hypothetical protein